MHIPVLYTFVLSQMFGLFALIIVIVMLNRREYYRKMIFALKANNPVIITTAMFSLILGIFLVYTHNIWELKYRVVVTTICWAIFVNSVFWLTVPEKMLAMMKRVFSGNGYYWLISLLGVVGCILLGRGVMLYILNYAAMAPH